MPVSAYGVARVGGALWTLPKGSATVIIRDARTGELTRRIDLLDEGAAVAVVGERIWVATLSGHLYIFDSDGCLIGSMQSPAQPRISRLFTPAPDVVLSLDAAARSFTVWDTVQLLPKHTVSVTAGGDVITDIAAADLKGTLLVVSTASSTRLYSTEGNMRPLALMQEGARCLHLIKPLDVALPALATLLRMRPDGSADAAPGARGEAVLWAAQPKWIAVLRISVSSSGTYRISHEKTVSCAGVREIFSLSPHRVGTFDDEGLLTLWNTSSGAPLRSFKLPGLAPSSTFHCVATQLIHTVAWSIGDQGKALAWVDESLFHEDPSPNDTTFLRDLAHEEVQFLRRKLHFSKRVADLFREKVKGLFAAPPVKGKGSPERVFGAAARAFEEIDVLYEKALDAWEKENSTQEPLPAFTPREMVTQPMDSADYWKQCHADAERRVQELRHENAALLAALQPAEGDTQAVDVRRAQHICQIIREKNDLRERERELTQDVARLRVKLRELGSPLGSAGPVDDTEELRRQCAALSEEVKLLKTELQAQDPHALAQAQKQNAVLKQRVRTLRQETDDAQRQLSEANTRNQEDIDRLLLTLSALRAERDTAKEASELVSQERTRLQQALAELEAKLHDQAAEMESIQRELARRDTVERSSIAEVRKEINVLCESLDDRDQRLIAAQNAVAEMQAVVREKTAICDAAVADRDIAVEEVEILKAHVRQLEDMMADRKQYARTVSELQGRMELAIEELRRSFTPVQFAESVSSLESRIAGLSALEAQLRQKDDIIALRDDQLLTLQKHLAKLESTMAQVSGVFMHLPKSIDEVEQLMVEVDEYRRRVGSNPELRELIQIRLLDLRARRKAGDAVPILEELQPDETKPGKSHAELERLSQLRDSSLATSAIPVVPPHTDATGLVGTPRPGLNKTTN